MIVVFKEESYLVHKTAVVIATLNSLYDVIDYASIPEIKRKGGCMAEDFSRLR